MNINGKNVKNVIDYTAEQIKILKDIDIDNVKMTPGQLEMSEQLGLDVYNNGAGMWNFIMIQQGLNFREQYKLKADVAAYWEITDGYIKNVDVIEIRNDVAVFVEKN